jgi:hypothetical protein
VTLRLGVPLRRVWLARLRGCREETCQLKGCTERHDPSESPASNWATKGVRFAVAAEVCGTGDIERLTPLSGRLVWTGVLPTAAVKIRA